MSKAVLIKPYITEKTERLIENANQYTFVVAKTANKVEISKAIERVYNVNVTAVSTLTLPGKRKSKYTNSGMVEGRKPAFKKAVVSIKEGEVIEYYGDI